MILGLEDSFPFGKHKGKLIAEILKEDYSYVEWWQKTIEDYQLSEDFYPLVKEAYDLDQRKIRKGPYGEWTKRGGSTRSRGVGHFHHSGDWEDGNPYGFDHFDLGYNGDW